MPPRPPPPLQPPFSATTTTLIFFIVFPFLVNFATPHNCTPPHPTPTTTTTTSSCPPFSTSTPPYPFSSSPGCGHPSFQIQCKQPHATITINNLTFSILHYSPNTPTTITLSPTNSPLPPPHHHHNCTPSSHTLHPISLHGTPFKVSDSSCSRLSIQRPCPPPNLPNCSHCSWQCKLIKNPMNLLEDCVYTHRSTIDSQQGCHGDILRYLDSFLQLGIEVEWDEEEEGKGDSFFSNCKACREDGHGFCGFNASDPRKSFLCFAPSTTPRLEVKQQSPNRVAMLSIVSIFVCFLIIASVGGVAMRNRKSLPAEEDPTAVFLRRHRAASLLPPVFTYDELEASTNHFDPKRKIGDGGFGSVYLGQLYDGRIVAVKYLHNHKNNNNHQTSTEPKKKKQEAFSTESFCNEILILSSINHPNLVKLHGYCSDPRGLLLVYDYVPNGTLADHLHGKHTRRKGCLTWNLRVEMALQIASAMEYLHFSVVPPIVHRDITSSNIFVEKDMRVRVGDFGLSRLLICTEATMVPGDSSGGVCTGPQGTPGYLDPDYYRSFRLNEKSDIYSFGVVLMELITGLKAVDQRREKREVALADMVVSKIQMGLLHQVVDPVLVGEEGEVSEGVDSVAELAFRCVATDKDDRPDAREVAAELKRIRVRGGSRGAGSGLLRMSNSSNVVAPDDGSGMLRMSSSSSVVVPDGVGLV